MPRVLHVLALVTAFVVSGAPTWIAELAEDDCAEKCSDETTCPDEGCANCSIVCSSCPRTHYVTPQTATIVAASLEVSAVAHDVGDRLPLEPPLEGVFHPPRRAG